MDQLDDLGYDVPMIHAYMAEYLAPLAAAGHINLGELGAHAHVKRMVEDMSDAPAKMFAATFDMIKKSHVCCVFLCLMSCIRLDVLSFGCTAVKLASGFSHAVQLLYTWFRILSIYACLFLMLLLTCVLNVVCYRMRRQQRNCTARVV